MTIPRRPPNMPRPPAAYRISPAAQALFQNINEAMSDGLLIIDQLGRVALVNPALGQMLGLAPQAMLGKYWSELFLDDRTENDAFHDLVLEVAQRQISHHNRQVTYHPPQGPARELIITTDLLTIPGKHDRTLAGMLAIFKDITEIKALHKREQELLERSRRLYQEKLDSLDRLARALAHEIRNPVMSIGGLSKRLLDRYAEQGGPLAEYLRRIIESSLRLEQIVGQVRAYADLPSPYPSPLELLPWLTDLAQSYQGRAQAQGVRLTLPLELPEIRGLAASVDAQLLGRLMATLMDNALEAMPLGGELSLGLDRIPGPDRAIISVTDTGHGIEPADLPFIFAPFFTTKAAGVGMNLAIAKRIADDHGGSLEAQSPSGQGATFRLGLPLRP
jgi:PAS domain S-box-containing protein